MDALKIDRIGGGGIAAPNLPGSGFVSSGEQLVDALSDVDQAIVEKLFNKPPPKRPAQQSDPDSFRITRTQGGRAETIEVPGALMPAALKACVIDRLE